MSLITRPKQKKGCSRYSKSDSRFIEKERKRM